MTRGWGEKVSHAFSPFVALFRGLSPWRTVHFPELTGGRPWNSGHVSRPLWDSDLPSVLSCSCPAFGGLPSCSYPCVKRASPRPFRGCSFFSWKSHLTVTASRGSSCPPVMPVPSPAPLYYVLISLFYCLSSTYHYLKLS